MGNVDLKALTIMPLKSTSGFTTKKKNATTVIFRVRTSTRFPGTLKRVILQRQLFELRTCATFLFDDIGF